MRNFVNCAVYLQDRDATQDDGVTHLTCSNFSNS